MGQIIRAVAADDMIKIAVISAPEMVEEARSAGRFWVLPCSAMQ